MENDASGFSVIEIEAEAVAVQTPVLTVTPTL
jgi:hypothetical protein